MRRALTRRRARLAAAAWIAAVVATFAGQFAAQAAWDSRDAYSWARNNISDLGMVTCRTYGDDDRYVCSPWHVAANSGFIAYGVLVLVGVITLRPLLRTRRSSVVAAALVVACAVGSIIVGLAPADTHAAAHAAAAGAVFIAGNLAMLVAAPALIAAGVRGAGWLGVALGIAGLVSIPVFTGALDIGLDRGTAERIVVWSLDVWNVAVAVSLLRCGRRSDA